VGWIHRVLRDQLQIARDRRKSGWRRRHQRRHILVIAGRGATRFRPVPSTLCPKEDVSCPCALAGIRSLGRRPGSGSARLAHRGFTPRLWTGALNELPHQPVLVAHEHVARAARTTGLPPLVATVPPAPVQPSTASSRSPTTRVNAGDPGSFADDPKLDRGTPRYSVLRRSRMTIEDKADAGGGTRTLTSR